MGMAERVMRVPRPRLETLRRRVPGQPSTGDYGIVRSTGALLDILEDAEKAGHNGVTGYRLRYSVPFQMGATVADAVFGLHRTRAGMSWVAYRVDVQWSGVPARGDWLETRAELVYLTRHLARFAVTAECGAGPCASGLIHYAAIRPGARPGRKVENPASEASVVGASHIHRYSPVLLQLLMNPAPGSREPLGRRIHPLGSVPLAAAVFQAMELTPGGAPVSASMRYLAPARTDIGFIAEAERTDKERQGPLIRVEFQNEEGAMFAVCTVTMSG